jgi:uncharacterized protein YecE (DUF72 family)
VYDTLRSLNIALVIFDHPWLPEFDKVTADFSYIRWHGDRRKVDGEKGETELDRSEELIRWAGKIKDLEVKDIYGYFSKFYLGYPPSDIRILQDTFTLFSS